MSLSDQDKADGPIGYRPEPMSAIPWDYSQHTPSFQMDSVPSQKQHTAHDIFDFDIDAVDSPPTTELINNSPGDLPLSLDGAYEPTSPDRMSSWV